MSIICVVITLQNFFLRAMGKRDTNINESNLPAPPKPDAFVQHLRTWYDKEMNRMQRGQGNDPLYGDTFARQKIEKKKGTRGTERCGVQCALQFADLLASRGIMYETLSEWAIAWAKFVLKPEHLFDDKADMDTLRQQRQELLNTGRFKDFNLPIKSFKTYLNAVGRAFTEESGDFQACVWQKLNAPHARRHSTGIVRTLSAQCATRSTGSAPDAWQLGPTWALCNGKVPRPQFIHVGSVTMDAEPHMFSPYKQCFVSHRVVNTAAPCSVAQFETHTVLSASHCEHCGTPAALHNLTYSAHYEPCTAQRNGSYMSCAVKGGG